MSGRAFLVLCFGFFLAHMVNAMPWFGNTNEFSIPDGIPMIKKITESKGIEKKTQENKGKSIAKISVIPQGKSITKTTAASKGKISEKTPAKKGKIIGHVAIQRKIINLRKIFLGNIFRRMQAIRARMMHALLAQRKKMIQLKKKPANYVSKSRKVNKKKGIILTTIRKHKTGHGIMIDYTITRISYGKPMTRLGKPTIKIVTPMIKLVKPKN